MLKVNSSTPWGRAQAVSVLVPDQMVSVSCAGHGGVKVYRTLNKLIPAPLRSPFMGKAGWYEEDCEAAIPLYFLHDRLPEKDRERLKKDRLLATIHRHFGKQAEEAGLPKPPALQS